MKFESADCDSFDDVGADDVNQLIEICIRRIIIEWKNPMENALILI